jgi:hypothetical protein
MTFGTKKKWPYKTGDLLRGSIHMKFSMTGQEKGDKSTHLPHQKTVIV